MVELEINSERWKKKNKGPLKKREEGSKLEEEITQHTKGREKINNKQKREKQKIKKKERERKQEQLCDTCSPNQPLN